MSDEDIFADDVPEKEAVQQDNSELDLQSYAAWYARKLMLLDAEEERIKNQSEALLKQIRGNRESIKARHGRRLLQMMESESRDKKPQKVITVYGTVFPVRIAGRVATDANKENEVAAWATANAPETVSLITKIDKRRLTTVVNEHFKATGEVPDGFAYYEPVTKIGVRYAGDEVKSVEIE